MHQFCAHLLGGNGQVPGAQGVHLKGILGVALAAVHIGVGGAVDDHIRLHPAHKGHNLVPVGDVQLIRIGGNDLGRTQLFRNGPNLGAAFLQLAQQLGAQLAVAARDQNLHIVSAPLFQSAQYFSLLSATCFRCLP